MRRPVNLILFSKGANKDLIHFFGSNPDIHLTVVKTDQQSATRVRYRTIGGSAMLSIPQPKNKFFLGPAHHLKQMIYARRIADIMHPYLYGKSSLIFWISSVDYVRVCEILKHRYHDARFIYVHQEWSWKRYLNLPDNIFSTYWMQGDISLSRAAFEMTAYEQKIALLADRVVTLTHQAAGFFTNVLNISTHKITTIRNGADRPYTEKPILSRGNRFGLSPNERIILYVGDISHSEGVYFLMHAFKRIAEDSQNIKLLIAGEGDYRSLLDLVKPYWGKVIFTGTLSIDDINQLIDLAEVGVVPSLYGQYSPIAMNMRLRKLPVIISAIDGLNESFEDGVDALKINILRNGKNEAEIDVAELEEKIRRLLTDKKLAEALSENSYAIAAEKFGLNEMCISYLQLLDEESKP